MTITISSQTYLGLLQQGDETAQHFDSSDPLDVTYELPKLIGQGFIRWLELRQGLELEIFDARLPDRLIINCPERPEWLRYHFHISGQHEDKHTTVSNREYALYGSGLAPKEATDGPEQQALEVTVYVHPEVLCSFIGSPTGQLPTELQPLVRPIEQERYTRVTAVTRTMESVLWQILRCPYRGMNKRMYLEGKALELASLVMEQEIEIRNGTFSPYSLKPDVVDRVHHARDILLQRLDNPPSLLELARQVGVNQCMLNRGFRQIFGTTAFGYLRDHRLEQARKLLETRTYSVEEVARIVGYRNLGAFSEAFRKRFGTLARDCRKRGSAKAWV